MSLTLTIVKSDDGLGKPIDRQVIVPPEAAFNIGRSENSDWVLPDANEVISRHHCKVEYRADAYYLTDISRHGVTIDGVQVAKSIPMQLEDRAILAIGHYEIQVVVTNSSKSRPPPFGDAAPGGESKLTLNFPERDDDPFGQSRRHSGESDPFAALGESNRSDPTFVTHPAPTAPVAPDEETIVSDGMTNEGSRPAFVLDPNWRNKKSKPADQHERKQAPIILQDQTPSMERTAASATSLSSSEPVQAFLRGAGLPETLLTPAQQARAMELAGAIFRETVAGLSALLEAKHDFKELLGADLTRFGTLVNPLRAGRNVDMMMKAILTEHELFMPSVDAVRDGLAQMKCHEVALIAGMKAAVQQLVKTFDPEAIAEAVEGEATLGQRLTAGPRARYWEAFKKLHEEIADEMDEGARNRIMSAFARAYNDQARRCT